MTSFSMLNEVWPEPFADYGNFAQPERLLPQTVENVDLSARKVPQQDLPGNTSVNYSSSPAVKLEAMPKMQYDSNGAQTILNLQRRVEALERSLENLRNSQLKSKNDMILYMATGVLIYFLLDAFLQFRKK